MEYHYTKEVSHIAEWTYTKVPLLQLTIDLWNITTPNQFNIQQNAHIPRANVPPPINHKSIAYHYTKEVSHIAEWTYTKVPLLQLTIDL